MMFPIQTARHAHAVRSQQQLAARQVAYMKRAAGKTGDPVRQPWRAPCPILGYISAGVWCGDCTCGNGVAIEPQWSEAFCFSCGAIYAVTLPPDSERAEIERVLSLRPRRNQHWRPQDGERLPQLIAENRVHGITGGD